MGMVLVWPIIMTGASARGSKVMRLFQLPF
jgi:hypothetical protein